jgi:hypothetical protein
MRWSESGKESLDSMVPGFYNTRVLHVETHALQGVTMLQIILPTDWV